MSLAVAAHIPAGFSNPFAEWLRARADQFRQSGQSEIIDVEATLVSEPAPRNLISEARQLTANQAAQPILGYAPAKTGVRMVHSTFTPGLLINCSA